MITLKKGEVYYIENRCYIILKGKGVTKCIMPSGKTVVNESLLKSNDILYNFLFINNDLIDEKKILKDGEVLFKAFEDSILKEVELNNQFKDKLASQSFHYYILKELQLAITSIEYLLITLKRYSYNNSVDRTIILYDNFNISRSQFYLIIQRLKKDKLLIEEGDKYILNY